MDAAVENRLRAVGLKFLTPENAPLENLQKRSKIARLTTGVHRALAKLNKQ